jgi:hypothetical protein
MTQFAIIRKLQYTISDIRWEPTRHTGDFVESLRPFQKVAYAGHDLRQVTNNKGTHRPPSNPTPTLQFRFLCASDARLGRQKLISSNIRSSWGRQYKQRKFIGRFETYIRQTRVRCLYLDSDNLRSRGPCLHIDNKPIVWTILTKIVATILSVACLYWELSRTLRVETLNLFKERASWGMCLIILWIQLQPEPQPNTLTYSSSLSEITP